MVRARARTEDLSQSEDLRCLSFDRIGTKLCLHKETESSHKNGKNNHGDNDKILQHDHLDSDPRLNLHIPEEFG